jgi:hypothetical protein
MLLSMLVLKRRVVEAADELYRDLLLRFIHGSLCFLPVNSYRP